MGRTLTGPAEAAALAARLELVYRALWGELHRRDDDGLRQHEAQLLSHVPEEGGVTLTWVAGHLLLPKSTASVLVRSLEDRGLVRRERRPDNQRELAITLTPEGVRRVAASTLLDTGALAETLAKLSTERVEAALETLEEVVRVRRGARRHSPSLQSAR
ncbi:MAG TPA: MarR family winged helix-turn-helix transcriptional regulator [Terriglobales bacterium]|nr:MarR family winged helix-turn-helix transcriptional regulator [Terriglobales bacterium]